MASPKIYSLSFVQKFEYAVLALTPSNRPIFPASALITSSGASIAIEIMLTFFSRYGIPILPIRFTDPFHLCFSEA